MCAPCLQVLPAASRAAGRVPLEFLRLVVAGDGSKGGLAERGTEARTMQEWRLRLTYYVYEALGRLRIGAAWAHGRMGAATTRWSFGGCMRMAGVSQR
jgi:hypothetical protein